MNKKLCIEKNGSQVVSVAELREKKKKPVHINTHQSSGFLVCEIKSI